MRVWTLCGITPLLLGSQCSPRSEGIDHIDYQERRDHARPAQTIRGHLNKMEGASAVRGKQVSNQQLYFRHHQPANLLSAGVKGDRGTVQSNDVCLFTGPGNDLPFPPSLPPSYLQHDILNVVQPGQAGRQPSQASLKVLNCNQS